MESRYPHSAFAVHRQKTNGRKVHLSEEERSHFDEEHGYQRYWSWLKEKQSAAESAEGHLSLAVMRLQYEIWQFSVIVQKILGKRLSHEECMDLYKQFKEE